MRFRRVPSATACEFCRLVSGQTYVSAESAHFGHAKCGCLVIPVPGSERFVDVLDNFTLDVDDSKQRHGREIDGRFVYDPERKAIHDRYVAEQLAPGRSVDDYDFVVMGGGPASGKSTLINSGRVRLPDGHVMVNADEAKELLPDYNKALQLNHKRAAEFVHEESSDMAKRLTSEALRKSQPTVLDGVGDGSLDSLRRKVNEARENGAGRVIGEYVTVDLDEALRRAAQRTRPVPPTVVKDGHVKVSRIFREAADDDLFDELRLYDTNLPGDPVLIYEKIDGVENILDPAAFDRFLAKATA